MSQSSASVSDVPTLDDLAGDWLSPQCEEDFSLPAITNFHGMVQVAWDICGIQNWNVRPDQLPTPTALLVYRENGRVCRFPPRRAFSTLEGV